MQVVEKKEEIKEYPLKKNEKRYDIIEMEPEFPSKQEIKFPKSRLP